jgi:sigma-B regulation protein RsbU (phosphoserine phosphatase)
MNVLIADDDAFSRKVLGSFLHDSGYEAAVAEDGVQAWEHLERSSDPSLLILDVQMPRMDGIALCERIRESKRLCYIVLLTSLGRKEDLVAGIRAGADDYLTKPFDREELKVRLESGTRVLRLQKELAKRVTELEAALTQVKLLQGLLPICSYCKKIRDSKNYWQQVERYISSHADVTFTHGVCPDCYDRIMRSVAHSNESGEANGKCHTCNGTETKPATGDN